VQSLERGIAILDAVAASGPRRMSVQELARALSLSASTVSRLAATLRDHGLLSQQGNAGGYGLGLELLRYARSASLDHPLPNVAGAVVERLMATLDETVSFSVPTDDGMLYVRSETPQGHMVTIRISVGNTLPYTTTASGKAVLAAQSPAAADAAVRRGLPLRTDASIATARQLHEQIEEVIARGYAIEVGESNAEVACVAVAVIGKKGEPLGALSCNIPAMTVTPERFDYIARRLAEGAREIEAALRKLG
jgi:DNA-binding IclR family transcriptional regulator